MLSDHPREHCGLFGIYGHPEAVWETYLGLYSLQHRGQEAAGIVSSDGKVFKSYKGMGLVRDVFSPETLKEIRNPIAIGHLRYSTTGTSNLINTQPIVFNYSKGQVAIAHNGNLVNASQLRDEYEAYGSIFQTTMDTEVIAHLMAKPAHVARGEELFQTLNHLQGAFSLLLLTANEIIGVRDKNGFRPLVLGRLDGAYILASETCAFDHINATFLREIEPGEVVTIGPNGVESRRYCKAEEVKPSYCIFEHIYFARPDSFLFGDNALGVRKRLGAQLAREQPAPADAVISVPDSGNYAALGFSQESKIPLEYGLIRNHYVGRTFIRPSQDERTRGVEMKLNVVKEVVKGKRLVVVDDSIIRGTTAKSRIKLLREAGAKEIHMRISCPPHRHPCHYGIDFPTKSELFAASATLEEMRKFIGADTLGYLSQEGMLKCISQPPEHYCTACFSGVYPVPVHAETDKHVLEK